MLKPKYDYSIEILRFITLKLVQWSLPLYHESQKYTPNSWQIKRLVAPWILAACRFLLKIKNYALLELWNGTKFESFNINENLHKILSIQKCFHEQNMSVYFKSLNNFGNIFFIDILKNRFLISVSLTHEHLFPVFKLFSDLHRVFIFDYDKFV